MYSTYVSSNLCEFIVIFLHLIYNFFSILYILPPSGKRNCAIPGIAGEEHTDHTSLTYCASTKQNMVDGYSVAAEIKVKGSVSQRPHKQNMRLQRPIRFSCLGEIDTYIWGRKWLVSGLLIENLPRKF